MPTWLTATATPRLAAQSRRLELDADDEHEQQHPDLTEELQDRQRGVGKQDAARRRRQPAEQRGPERQPGGDLADHRRLSDASRQPAERSGGKHDHDQLERAGAPAAAAPTSTICANDRHRVRRTVADRAARAVSSQAAPQLDQPGDDQHRAAEREHVDGDSAGHAEGRPADSAGRPRRRSALP